MMASELQNLVDRLQDAGLALEAAQNRMARYGNQEDGAVELAAAALIGAAEDVMFFAEEQSRMADEQVAYWSDPVAAQERMAAE